MGQLSEEISKQVSEELYEVKEFTSAETRPDMIKRNRYVKLSDKCVCERPYSHIICTNCGHLMFGRVRYSCPKHAMVTFLIDITNCPRCRAFHFMLNEFALEDNEEILKESL